MPDKDEEQACGYCGGSGRVPGPKHDRYGFREDYPDEVPCGYCGGSGTCPDGEKLTPAGVRRAGRDSPARAEPGRA